MLYNTVDVLMTRDRSPVTIWTVPRGKVAWSAGVLKILLKLKNILEEQVIKNLWYCPETFIFFGRSSWWAWNLISMNSWPLDNVCQHNLQSTLMFYFNLQGAANQGFTKLFHSVILFNFISNVRESAQIFTIWNHD